MNPARTTRWGGPPDDFKDLLLETAELNDVNNHHRNPKDASWADSSFRKDEWGRKVPSFMDESSFNNSVSELDIQKPLSASSSWKTPSPNPAVKRNVSNYFATPTSSSSSSRSHDNNYNKKTISKLRSPTCITPDGFPVPQTPNLGSSNTTTTTTTAAEGKSPTSASSSSSGSGKPRKSRIMTRQQMMEQRRRSSSNSHSKSPSRSDYSRTNHNDEHDDDENDTPQKSSSRRRLRGLQKLVDELDAGLLDSSSNLQSTPVSSSSSLSSPSKKKVHRSSRQRIRIDEKNNAKESSSSRPRSSSRSRRRRRQVATETQATTTTPTALTADDSGRSSGRSSRQSSSSEDRDEHCSKKTFEEERPSKRYHKKTTKVATTTTTTTVGEEDSQRRRRSTSRSKRSSRSKHHMETFDQQDGDARARTNKKTMARNRSRSKDASFRRESSSLSQQRPSVDHGILEKYFATEPEFGDPPSSSSTGQTPSEGTSFRGLLCDVGFPENYGSNTNDDDDSDDDEEEEVQKPLSAHSFKSTPAIRTFEDSFTSLEDNKPTSFHSFSNKGTAIAPKSPGGRKKLASFQELLEKPGIITANLAGSKSESRHKTTTTTFSPKKVSRQFSSSGKTTEQKSPKRFLSPSSQTRTVIVSKVDKLLPKQLVIGNNILTDNTSVDTRPHDWDWNEEESRVVSVNNNNSNKKKPTEAFGSPIRHSGSHHRSHNNNNNSSRRSGRATVVTSNVSDRSKTMIEIPDKKLHLGRFMDDTSVQSRTSSVDLSEDERSVESAPQTNQSKRKTNNRTGPTSKALMRPPRMAVETTTTTQEKDTTVPRPRKTPQRNVSMTLNTPPSGRGSGRAQQLPRRSVSSLFDYSVPSAVRNLQDGKFQFRPSQDLQNKRRLSKQRKGSVRESLFNILEPGEDCIF